MPSSSNTVSSAGLILPRTPGVVLLFRDLKTLTVGLIRFTKTFFGIDLDSGKSAPLELCTVL
jgi:hypothetical protein